MTIDYKPIMLRPFLTMYIGSAPQLKRFFHQSYCLFLSLHVQTDRSFSFVTTSPPTSYFLKAAAGIEKGASKPGVCIHIPSDVQLYKLVLSYWCDFDCIVDVVTFASSPPLYSLTDGGNVNMYMLFIV